MSTPGGTPAAPPQPCQLSCYISYEIQKWDGDKGAGKESEREREGGRMEERNEWSQMSEGVRT